MKKILLWMVALVPSMTMCAQSGNPEDAKGVDFEKSVAMVVADIKAGGIKTFDQSTLEKYSKKVPLANKVTDAVFAETYKCLKDQNFDLMTYLNRSNLPEVKKTFFAGLYASFLKLDKTAFQENLSSKVQEIQKSKLSPEEKTEQLSSIAILYHAMDVRSEASKRSPQSVEYGCGAHPVECGVLGGFIIGAAICGPMCSLGGAIIGGVVGAILGSSK